MSIYIPKYDPPEPYYPELSNAMSPCKDGGWIAIDDAREVIEEFKAELLDAIKMGKSPDQIIKEFCL